MSTDIVLFLLTTYSVHPASIKITVRHPMTSATGTILILFDSAVLSANVISFSIEITRMTGSTIDCSSLRRCILQMGIRKRIVHGIAVAATTPWVPSVVARVVR